MQVGSRRKPCGSSFSLDSFVTRSMVPQKGGPGEGKQQIHACWKCVLGALSQFEVPAECAGHGVILQIGIISVRT